MVRTNRMSARRKFASILFVLICFCCCDCASARRKDRKAGSSDSGKSVSASESESMAEVYEADESMAVSIPIKERKRVSFFHFVDPSVMELFEDGSLESIQRGLSKIRKNDSSYTDAERVLIYVSSNVMKICWPSVRLSFPSVEVGDLSNNTYVGAVDFARDGIYDFSAGDSDFLSLVLPSLTLLSSSSNDDYFDKAEPALEKALEMRRNSVLANYLLAVLKEKSGLYADACGYLEKAKRHSSCFEILCRLSECYLKNGDNEKSRVISENMASSGENFDLKAVKLSAESAFAMGDLDSASRYVVRVLQSEPENLKFLLLHAKIYILKGDYIHASALLDSHAKSNTTSRDYLILRAKVQKEWNKNFIAAAFTLESAVSLYPDDVGVLLAVAKLSSEIDAPVAGKTSGEYAAEILSIQSDNADAIELQIEDFMQRGDFEAAYALSVPLVENVRLDELSDSDDGAWEVLFNHIKVCLASKRNDEAWQLSSSLYSKNSGNEKSVQSYISVLVAMSKKSEAKKLIAELLPGSSSKMKSFLYYQKSFVDSGEDNILSDLRSSLTSNPRNKDTLYRLYSIYYEKREYRKAQYYLKQLVSISPNDAGVKALNDSLDSKIKSGK